MENISQEYLDMLFYNGDFPIGKYNLGNYYYNRSDFENAEKYFLKALEQDEELHEIKTNLAVLYSSMGQPTKSEILLKDYLKHHPENYSAYYNLGLILAENKKYEESLEYLIMASKNLPYNSRVDYNIAMMYEFYKDLDMTEFYLKKAIDKEPNQTNYSNLLEFYGRSQQQIKANRLTEEIRGLFEL